jgi:XTP/dITP diphosphohydrolase
MVSFPDRLAIASRNAHKIREIREICTDWPVVWLTAEDEPSGWPEVQEPHDTYLANALEKARAVAIALELPSVADDSGIEVDALGGAPGPRSARFAGENASDGDNLRALIDAMRDLPQGDRSARYRCVAAIAWPDGRTIDAEGICEGSVLLEPRGSGGFGYDPIFVPVGLDVTMAELPPEEKHRISHRGRTFRALAVELAR